MIDIALETHPHLYRDYDAALEYLRGVNDNDYTYPPGRPAFHIYSEFKTDKEVLSLMSYCATQNLEKTKLIVWSDYDIQDNPRVQRFKSLIDFRVWNSREEAKGTILDGHPELLNAADEKHYLQSDLLRLLVLQKYGGVWIDMDIVLLRDFVPLLDQEFMYMWGSELDYRKEGACATVLSLHAGSALANEFLVGLTTARIVPNTACWGKEMFAQVYRKTPFTVLPSAFFNTEWCINATSAGLGDFIEDGWFRYKAYNKEFLFLEAFAWHWHNSSKRNIPLELGSKFDLLWKHTEAKLQERGI